MISAMRRAIGYIVSLLFVALISGGCYSSVVPAIPTDSDSSDLPKLISETAIANSSLVFRRTGTDHTVYLGMSNVDVEHIFQTPAGENSVKYYDVHSIQLSIASGKVFAIYVTSDAWTIGGLSAVGASVDDVQTVFGGYGEITNQIFGAPESFTSTFDILRFYFDESGELVDYPTAFVADFNIDESGKIFSASLHFLEMPLLDALFSDGPLPADTFATVFLEEGNVGNAAIPIGMHIPGDGLTIATIAHDGTHMEISSETWSVHLTGAYAGRKFLPEIEVGYINVAADGTWAITISQMVSMENENPAHGSGDNIVQFWLEPNDKLSLSHNSTGRFIVYIFPQFDRTSRQELLDITGAHSVELSELVDFANFYTLEIVSDGAWSIELIR